MRQYYRNLLDSELAQKQVGLTPRQHELIVGIMDGVERRLELPPSDN